MLASFKIHNENDIVIPRQSNNKKAALSDPLQKNIGVKTVTRKALGDISSNRINQIQSNNTISSKRSLPEKDNETSKVMKKVVSVSKNNSSASLSVCRFFCVLVVRIFQ
jgi:translation elongation factor EF-4